MSGYTSMLQEVVEGLSRRGHSIEDRGPDWVLVEDENGSRFKISVGEQVEGSTPIASPAAVSRGERGTRCAAPSRWYLAGRWNPGPCFLATGHPGEHMGAPPGQPWTPVPAGEVVSVPPPEMITIELELLKAFYDMAVGSMDYSSGFFDSTETDQIAYVGRLLGVDQTPPSEPTPHLWHQDCALPWRCGQSAGAEIHRVEMPHA